MFQCLLHRLQKSVTRRIRIYAGSDKGIAHGEEPVMVFDGGPFRYNCGWHFLGTGKIPAFSTIFLVSEIFLCPVGGKPKRNNTIHWLTQ